ncbi:MAG: hypothetical protein OEU46_11010, partial [Alphaproteobacteria bacterium]|nr:hypothetical protein [Alphaproteobacteria bacterium]
MLHFPCAKLQCMQLDCAQAGIETKTAGMAKNAATSNAMPWRCLISSFYFLPVAKLNPTPPIPVKHIAKLTRAVAASKIAR